MARTSLYNDNANRDFPFLLGTSFGPLSAIVGCGFMLGPNTGFVPGEHRVFLKRIARRDDHFYFYFSSDAPALIDKDLVFVRNVTDPPYVIEHGEHVPPAADSLSESVDSLSDSASVSVSESSPDLEPIDSPEARCDYADAFMGFLVTGPLEELNEALANDEDMVGESTVEPALLQSLANTYGSSINLANADRTRYQPPPECGDQELSEALYVRSTCLQDRIVFVPGFNALILQNDYDNSLTFSAAVGAGAGEPCEQVPIYADETPPEDSIYYEGGPSCAEVVRRVGGIPGPVVQLVAGDGVDISFQPSANSVVVNVDLHNLSSCESEILTADEADADCTHALGGNEAPIVLRAPKPTMYGLCAVLPPPPVPDHRVLSGVLSAPMPTMNGSLELATHVVASGSLMAPRPTLSGSTVSGTTGVGALFAPTPTLSGIVAVTAYNPASGSLSTVVPTIVGSAIVGAPHSIGFGSISAWSVAYGAGKYVVVGDNGAAAYSPDGLTWTTLPAGVSTGIKFGTNPAYKVRFVNGLFIVVGAGGMASYSADGVNWTALPVAPTTGVKLSPQDGRAVGYIGTKYFVAGGDGVGSYSTDAINWTAISGGSLLLGMKIGHDAVLSLATSPGGRIVAGADRGRASYSDDGLTWTELPAGTTTGIKFGTWNVDGGAVFGLTYGAGKFVAVGGHLSGNSGLLSYSADGETWTSVPPGVSTGIKFGTNTSAFGVAYGDDRFVVVGGNGKASYSDDGVNWTVLTAGASTGIKFGTSINANDVAYGDGSWVVVGGTGAASWSADGINWVALTG